MKFRGIKVPVLFQYSLTGGRIVPCISAGISCQYFLSASYRQFAEEESIFHEINTYEDQYMFFKKGEFSGVCGLGLRTRILTKLNINLMLMMEAGNGIFLNKLPGDVNSMKVSPYNQSSLQSALLPGITF